MLQGDRGLSQKGPEPGNASYYYSLHADERPRHRRRAAGRPPGVRARVDGSRVDARARSGPDLVGWDWFALQLDDGREVMVYRLRRRDGTADPHSAGALSPPTGPPGRSRRAR